MWLHRLTGLGMAGVVNCGSPARPAYARALVIALQAQTAAAYLWLQTGTLCGSLLHADSTPQLMTSTLQGAQALLPALCLPRGGRDGGERQCLQACVQRASTISQQQPSKGCERSL